MSDLSLKEDKLSGAEKKRLRGKAQNLDPILSIGKAGLSAAFLSEVEKALNEHQLIKVHFSHFKEQRKTLSLELADKSESLLLTTIGHNAVLYRQGGAGVSEA